MGCTCASEVKADKGSCSHRWERKYRLAGSEKLLSIGPYPEITLADAREQSAEIARQLAKGIDPSAARKVKKAEERAARVNTFREAALQWHAVEKPSWRAKHAERVMQRLERNLFDHIGDKPMKEITPADVVGCIKRMASRGVGDQARRTFQAINQTFRFAISSGWLTSNPCAQIEVRHLVPRKEVEHRAAITDRAQYGALLRAIDGYPNAVIRHALQLLSLTAVRPAELRHMEWSEIDWQQNVWKIPPAKLKMGAVADDKEGNHHVPLSKQALALLEEAQAEAEDGQALVFPGFRPKRPLSENTFNIALRAMGYEQSTHVAHGFRSSFSTMANEARRWLTDAIERQLAHKEKNAVRGAYNRATHLDERRKLMQWWADECDRMRADVPQPKQSARKGKRTQSPAQPR